MEKNISFADHCSLIVVQPLKKHVAGCIVLFLLGVHLPQIYLVEIKIPIFGF